MLDKLSFEIGQFRNRYEEYQYLFEETNIPSKTIRIRLSDL